MPPITDDDNGGDRDKRGRWKPGNRGGPGGARHEYIQDRARLYEALRQQISTEKLQTLWQRLYTRALKGDIRAAALLLAYRLGKVPEAVTARELFPLARVPREPAPTIEAIAAAVQRTLEDYQGGRLTAEEARISQDLLSTLLQARQVGELSRKFDELRLAMERSDNGEPS
jgi:uncharacterized protein DUF5681